MTKTFKYRAEYTVSDYSEVKTMQTETMMLGPTLTLITTRELAQQLVDRWNQLGQGVWKYTLLA